MKKIIILAACLISLQVFANETLDVKQFPIIDTSKVDLSIENTKMPTDDEIKAVIETFDFDNKQKEYLFKEVKKKLQDIYKN